MFLKLILSSQLEFDFFEDFDSRQFYFAKDNIVCGFKAFQVDQFYIEFPNTKSLQNNGNANLNDAKEDLDYIINEGYDILDKLSIQLKDAIEKISESTNQSNYQFDYDDIVKFYHNKRDR